MNADQQLEQFAATHKWLSAETRKLVELPPSRMMAPAKQRRWRELFFRNNQLKRELNRFLQRNGGATA